MNVALVYDRVNKWGGAERVLLALHELFPKAPLLTTVYDKEKAPWASNFNVKTSFLQNIPFARTNHELFPWLSSIAFEQFNFDKYDVVISVTSAEAKGVITKPGTVHICYCLTPTRYLWSHTHEYLDTPLKRLLLQPIISKMRIWDQVASTRPDHYIAISTAVQNRVKKYYRRDSEIIYPPATFEYANMQISKYSNKNQNSNEAIEQWSNSPFFLIVSRLVSYKKVDLAVKVFNTLNIPLIIVGKGRDEEVLKRLAGKNISFVPDLTDNELAWYYRGSRALVMPQEEDFGLVAVEAQSFGCPVIAYRGGGAGDSIVENKTGMFFDEQTEKSLTNAILEFEKRKFKKEECIENARKFSKERFKKEITEYIKTHS